MNTELNIVIDGMPPTKEKIEQWHQEADLLAQSADRSKRRLKGVLNAIFAMSVFALALAVYFDVLTWTLAVALVVAVVVALVVAVVVDVALSVALAMVLVVAVPVALGVAVPVAVAMSVALAVAMAVAVPVALCEWWYDQHVEIPRIHARDVKTDLIELDATMAPNACIAYDGYCQEATQVAAYQKKISAMGRRPIMAEYEASKQWVEGAEARQRDNEK